MKDIHNIPCNGIDCNGIDNIDYVYREYDDLEIWGRFITREEEDIKGRIIYLKELFHNNTSPSRIYFIRHLIERLAYNRIEKKKNLMRSIFKIHFNSAIIRNTYGSIVYIYFKSKNSSGLFDNWVRFSEPLPYGSTFEIRFQDTKKYNDILITHLDFNDPLLDPILIQEAIENPLFQFSIDKVYKNYFSFNDYNKVLQCYFVKEISNYKGYRYKKTGYKSVFYNTDLLLNSDSPRYNYLYNKLVLKIKGYSSITEFKHGHCHEYKRASKMILKLYSNFQNPMFFILPRDDYARDTFIDKLNNESKKLTKNESDYYRTLWFIADKCIHDKIKEYNISNFDKLIYQE
tara:strand:- start:9 stop:1043 length:1035 start_codon:yes stop_codon:yes gene_type:complete